MKPAQAQPDTYSAELLTIISQAQSAYIDTANQQQSFEVLLQRILELTESRFGFIGEIRGGDGDQPYLKTIAISNIAWDDASRRFYAEHAPKGMEFRNLNSLFGPVIANGEALFSNDPAHDPRRAGVPPGHPALSSFMGLPFHAHGKLVGMLGVANRPGGYNSALHQQLSPLLNTLGQLIEALRRDALREQAQHSTQRQQQALRALNEITALPTRQLSSLLRQALQRAADFYQMPNALISHIQLDDVEVLYQVQNGAGLNEGQHLPLASTYCHLTLQHKDVLCIAHMGQSEYAEHPCYSAYGFESYISSVITVANRRFGTVSLSHSAPRVEGFDEADREFLRLFARWIGNLFERQQQEQERSRLLDRLQQITSQIPGMVFQYRQDKEGRRSFPYVSEGIREIYGFNPEQVQHNSSIIQQRIHPDDVTGMNASIDRSAAKLSLWQEEYRVLHPQQGMIWVEGKAIPQAQADGSVLWHGTINNISQRKRIEQTLRDERQRLSSIIEGTHVGTWEWNVQTGEAVFNQRWAEIAGYDLDELAPYDINTWLQLVHPDDLKTSQTLLNAHFNNELPYYDFKCRMRHKDGHWVWIQTHGRLVSRTPEGLPLMVYGTHTDISASHRQEEEISQARAFLQAVIDSSTEVAMIATDPNGLINLFNSGAERLLGYSSAEMLGQSPARFHLLSEIEEHGTRLSRELGRPIEGFDVFVERARSGASETRHWTYIRKDGAQRLVNLTVTAVVDEQQQPCGFLGIANDITDLMNTTRALQDSEQRFRGMISNLPGAVYRCRNDGHWSMLHISDEVERLTGYPASDFTEQRRTFASIILPSDLAITQTQQERLAAREVFELTYRIRHAQGHIVWVSEKGQGEYNDSGELLWLDGFIWDISERHIAEQARQISEEKLSALYLMSPVAIALNRMSNGTLIEGNPQLEILTGYSLEEMRQLRHWDITPREYAPQEELVAQALNQHGTFGPYEKAFIRKDGSRVPILVHGSSVTSADGEPLVWSIIQDISDRVRAEQDSREREDYVRTVIDNVIDGIITFDEAGQIESINRAAEQIFALTPQTALGLSVTELLAEPHRERYRQQVRDQLEQSGVEQIELSGELEGCRHTGERFPLELALSRISHHGQEKLIAVVRDITERKRIERMKNEFVSTVSHELRTPLTSISGSLGLINGGALGEIPSSMQAMLMIAQQNSQRLSNLINDLLDMDKLVAGKMNFNLRPQLLWPLLNQALQTNQPYADEYTVHWQVEDIQADLAVQVDDQRFLQVMANLLSNAAKYSPSGDSVSIRAYRQGEQVRIEVEDHGSGIPADFQAQIFSKFSQADASDSRQKGGTGLGLAISRELVERMHGQIGFQSAAGHGTCFWFTLPVARIL